MVVESWPLEAVGGSAGLFHTGGHSGWTAGEHANLGQQEMLFLEVVEEGLEVWSAEVGDGAQAREQTAAREPLEVALTNVLCGEGIKGKGGGEGRKKERSHNITWQCVSVCVYDSSMYILLFLALTSMVVRKSNLSKN